MARPRQIDEQEVMGRLARVFATSGYEGASIQMLSQAAGLKKASLYHRYPGGKAQMADEVLATVQAWANENVVAPLASDAPLKERISKVTKAFDELYGGGTKACLLNMLSTFPGRAGPYEDRIRLCFRTMLDALCEVARQAGAGDPEARAQSALMLLQGSLVLSRGLGSKEPFEAALANFSTELTK